MTGLIRIAFEDGPKVNWAVRQALQWLLTDLYPLFRFCLSASPALCTHAVATGCMPRGRLFPVVGDSRHQLLFKREASRMEMGTGLGRILLFAVGLCRWQPSLAMDLCTAAVARRTASVSRDPGRQLGCYLSEIFLSPAHDGRSTWRSLIVVLLILEACLFMTAGFAFSRFDQAVHALFFTLSVYLVSAFILETAITFIGISWGTCTLVILYRDHQNPDKPQKTIDYEEFV